MSHRHAAELPDRPEVRELGGVYARAADRLLRLARSLTPGAYEELKAMRVRRESQAIVAGLNARAAQWAKRSITTAYNQQRYVQGARLSDLGAKRKKGFDSGVHSHKAANRVALATQDLVKANGSILQIMNRYTYLAGYGAQQLARVHAQLTEEEIIDILTENAIQKNWTSQKLSGMIKDYLLNLLEGDKFIVINGRHYNISKYAELVANVRIREAQTDATKAACEEWDNDLVRVSSHADPCPEICADFDGVVFSINGTTPGFPILIEEPPFHPNCKHSISATSLESIEWAKEHRENAA